MTKGKDGSTLKRAFTAGLTTWEKILVVTGLIIGFIFEYVDEFILTTTRVGHDVFPSFISSWDTYILLLINPSLYNPYPADICVVISFVAGTAGVFYLSLFLYATGRKKEGVLLFATLILGSIIILPFKLLIPRYRPYETNNLVKVTIQQSGNSFPSGHASRGFELASLFSYTGKKARILLYAYATIVALSRVYLGVHYPIDVVVGGIIGWIAGKLILRYQDHIIKLVSRLFRLPMVSTE